VGNRLANTYCDVCIVVRVEQLFQGCELSYSRITCTLYRCQLSISV